jgi:effector-binding domain-containing protein
VWVFTVKALPERPNLDHLRQQAKDLLATVRASHPDTSLAAAQTLLARQYGLRTWPDLKAEVERRRERPFPQEELAMPAEQVPVRLRPGRAIPVNDAGGRHVGSMTTMVLKTLWDQQVLRIRQRYRPGEHDAGKDYDAVLGVLMSEGLLQAGPPYYTHPHPDGDGVQWTESGVPVNRAGAGAGAVEAAVQPGGDAATALYFGPFSGLTDAHRQLREQIEAAGLRPGPGPRDVWHTSQEDTDPDNHVTELIWPLEA